MTISGPDKYHKASAYPRIHSPAIPRVVTEAEYRAILLGMLGVTEVLTPSYTIAQLEEAILANGLQLPIVRLPTHFLRGKKWFTNLGDVDMCNCGERWPHEQETK